MGGGREPSVEFYRCALTFGIVFLHCITFTPYEDQRPAWLSNIVCSCVDGFAIISGWFGIGFSVKKVFQLLNVALYAALVATSGMWLNGGLEGKTCADVVAWFLTVAIDNWYLKAYLFLMLIAPIVNVALERTDLHRKLLIPFFILLAWSAATDMPIIGAWMPRSPGLGSYTALTLLGCYVVGRLARMYRLDEILSRKALLAALPVLMFFTAMGLGDYSSPFAIGLGLAGFLLMKRLPVKGRIWQTCSPSMFAVFLIHCNVWGFGMIGSLEKVLCESLRFPVLVSIAVSAVIVFAAAFCLDIPRRIVSLCNARLICYNTSSLKK